MMVHSGSPAMESLGYYRMSLRDKMEAMIFLFPFSRPYGTEITVRLISPAMESLGYYRMSLRDKTVHLISPAMESLGY